MVSKRSGKNFSKKIYIQKCLFSNPNLLEGKMFEYIYSWGKLLELLCKYFPSNIEKKKSICWVRNEGLF